MLIINGGLPRSGTVLVGNLVRLMFERRGIRWTRYNPQERRHLPEFLSIVRSAPANPALIIHTHLIDPQILRTALDRAGAHVIWNIRDPRDCLVSLMKLHDLDLEHGLHAMQIYLSHTDCVWTGSPQAVRLRYEDLRADPRHAIKAITQALTFDLADEETEALITATSIEAHRQVMDRLADKTNPHVVTHRTKARAMREDQVTLINDRHIQSGARGRWRDELTPQDQQRANDALHAWVTRFGYDLV
ncbi:MAG: sulfotransferase domain-containing protein [Paracoccaceae bacterium]